MLNKEEALKKQLREKLSEYVNKRKGNRKITLDELQKWVAGDIEYEEFAAVIEQMEEIGILVPVKKSGTNNKKRPLWHGYTVIKEKLSISLIEKLRQFQLVAHPQLQLGEYLQLDEKVWEREYPLIVVIDQYLKKQGLPNGQATIPERSYELVGDEKWIEQHGGRRILERLGIWDKMNICMNPDPLMLTVYKERFCEIGTITKPHKHLIVENKSIFYMLQGLLKESVFTSLIYGCGWKITAGIKGALQQLDLEAEENEFYYFGDLDHEGIAIYEYLAENVKLALPFYEAILKLEPSKGKTNQKVRDESVAHFCEHFNKEQEERIKEVLSKGYYYPQEALSKLECLQCLSAYANDRYQ